MDKHRYDEIVGLLYDAALEPRLWQPALLAVSEAVGTPTAQLAFWDKPSMLPILSAVSREELHELNAQYTRHFSAIDPHTEKIRSTPDGRWLNFATVFDEAFVRRSEVYQEYLLPNGLRWSLAVRLNVAQHAEAIFAVLRGPQQAPFGPKETGFLECLTPHLLRAARIQSRLFQAEAGAARGAAALQHLAAPVLILDEAAHILFSNRAAESLLRAGEALRQRGNRLILPSPAAQNAVEALIRGAVHQRHGGATTLHDAAGLPLHLLVAPLAPDREANTPWERPLALVFIAHERCGDGPDGALLKALFQLTPAESRVALALLKGQTPAEYAEAACLSIATVRSQLRAIYTKTGTRRQADLIKRLASLAAKG